MRVVPKGYISRVAAGAMVSAALGARERPQPAWSLAFLKFYVERREVLVIDGRQVGLCDTELFEGVPAQAEPVLGMALEPAPHSLLDFGQQRVAGPFVQQSHLPDGIPHQRGVVEMEEFLVADALAGAQGTLDVRPELAEKEWDRRGDVEVRAEDPAPRQLVHAERGGSCLERVTMRPDDARIREGGQQRVDVDAVRRH